MKAREEGLKVDQIRKAKDRKIIVGCKNREDKERIKNKIRNSGNMEVEDIQNKDPLVVLRDVIAYNSDHDDIRNRKSKFIEIIRTTTKFNNTKASYAK